MWFTGRVSEAGGHHVAPAVSSTTPSKISVIETVVSELLQQHVNNGAVLDAPLPMFASFVADAFYDQQQSRNAGGTVALTDSTLAELSSFVRRQMELRSRRTSL